MGNFFHGWRRKAGFVTLVLACVLMAGWLRSLRIMNTTAFSISNFSLVQLISRDSSLTIRKTNAKYPVRGIPDRADRVILKAAEQPQTPTSRDYSYSFDEQALIGKGTPWIWSLDRHGFRIGRVEDGEFSLTAIMLVVPYWSVVTTLTIISGWLLLSKPRKTTSGPTHV